MPPGGWQQPASQPAYQPPGRLASWGSRAGAVLIDAAVLLIPGVILFVLVVGGAVGLSGNDDDVATGAAIAAFIGFGLLLLVVYLLYAPILMMRGGARNGQTLGKQVIGIRVVRDNGQAYTFGSAALREIGVKGLLVGIASSIIPVLPYLLDVLWPLWDDQNRALHDMIVSSHVVHV